MHNRSPIRKIGGIVHLKQNSVRKYSNIMQSYQKSPKQIEKQKRILEKSKKATYKYLLRKYINSIIMDVIEEAVDRI